MNEKQTQQNELLVIGPFAVRSASRDSLVLQLADNAPHTVVVPSYRLVVPLSDIYAIYADGAETDTMDFDIMRLADYEGNVWDEPLDVRYIFVKYYLVVPLKDEYAPYIARLPPSTRRMKRLRVNLCIKNCDFDADDYDRPEFRTIAVWEDRGVDTSNALQGDKCRLDYQLSRYAVAVPISEEGRITCGALQLTYRDAIVARDDTYYDDDDVYYAVGVYRVYRAPWGREYAVWLGNPTPEEARAHLDALLSGVHYPVSLLTHLVRTGVLSAEEAARKAAERGLCTAKWAISASLAEAHDDCALQRIESLLEELRRHIAEGAYYYALSDLLEAAELSITEDEAKLIDEVSRRIAEREERRRREEEERRKKMDEAADKLIAQIREQLNGLPIKIEKTENYVLGHEIRVTLERRVPRKDFERYIMVVKQLGFRFDGESWTRRVDAPN